jgi:hypothetical protein
MILSFEIDYNDTFILDISCSAIKIPIYNQLPPYQISDYNSNYHLQVEVEPFPCQAGE